MVAALLDAAAEILEAEGPDALSVRRIAAAAGVAPMGVYNHFESKNGIIDALFIQGFERLGEALATAIAEIEDPYEALREGGRRYRALALAHPMAYQLMFLRTIPGYEPSDAALEVAGRRLRQPRRRRRARHGRRRARRGPADRDRALIWANHHGWVSLELTGIGLRRGPGRRATSVRLSRVAARPPPLIRCRRRGGTRSAWSGRSRYQCRATDGKPADLFAFGHGIMPKRVMVRCPPSWSP